MIADDRIRLDPELKKTAEQAARRRGASLEQFVNDALADALALADARDFFAERSATADPVAFRALLQAAPATRPIPGDEIQDGRA